MHMVSVTCAPDDLACFQQVRKKPGLFLDETKALGLFMEIIVINGHEHNTI